MLYALRGKPTIVMINWLSKYATSVKLRGDPTRNVGDSDG